MDKLVCIGGFGYNFSKYIKKQNPDNINFIVYKNKKGFFDWLCRREITDDIEEIKTFVEKDNQRLFVLAGMGGNTGTNIISNIVKMFQGLSSVVIGVVSMPFECEGEVRKNKSAKEIEKLKDNVDVLIVIDNQKALDLYGNLDFEDAFERVNKAVLDIIKKISNEEKDSVINIIEVMENNEYPFLLLKKDHK